MASQVLSDVAPTDADRKSHDQMSKFVSHFGACETFAVQLGDCLYSEGKTYAEGVKCFDCLLQANDNYLRETFTCANLKEMGYCDAIDNCKDYICDTSCSLENEENCYIAAAGCTAEDNYYSSECLGRI